MGGRWRETETETDQQLEKEPDTEGGEYTEEFLPKEECLPDPRVSRRRGWGWILGLREEGLGAGPLGLREESLGAGPLVLGGGLDPWSGGGAGPLV